MLERPPAGGPPRTRRRRSPAASEPGVSVGRSVGRDIVGTRPVAAVTAALWAAVLGLMVIGVLVVLGWAVTGRGDDGIGTAFAAAGVGWLVAHHASVATESGATITLLPLAAMALPLLLLQRAGRWAARATGTTAPADAVLLVVAATSAYAVIAFGVAQVSSLGGATVPGLAALGWASLVAVVGLGWGVASGAGLLAPVLGAVTEQTRRTVLVAGVAGASLVVGAGLVSVVAVVARWSAVTGLERQVAPGAFDAVGLFLVTLAYLPNMLVWALSYLAGPGFSAGGGATIDPFSASGALLPAVPVFGAIPVDAPAAAPLLLLLPVLAGALAAFAVRRRGRLTLASEAAAVLLGSVVLGVAVALLGLLAGGALGSARLAVLGPNAWQTGLAVAGLVAAGGVLVSLTSRISTRVLPTLWVHDDAP